MTFCVLPQVLLANIAAAPTCALEELSIMHPDERQVVLRNTFSPLQLGPAVGAYARQTIHGMLEHWAATTPDAPAAAFQVGLPTTQHGLCSISNREQACHRQAVCLILKPCVQGGTLSYAELDTRANQLAHRLARLGVGPEVPVGVMMERSLDLIVALLGVLKAGGAYVPMDPSYPAERLALMMDDSEARLPCAASSNVL